MNTNIYYYSGTGNALALAKGLKSALGTGAKLIAITDFENEKNIAIDADAAGFVFPVYFLSIPAIVKEFIRKARFKSDTYVFAVAACNSVPGHSFFTIGRLLKTKKQRLSVGYSVVMPGISVVDGYLTSSEVNMQRIEDSKARILEIASDISKRVTAVPVGDNSVKTHITGALMTLAAGSMMNPKLFYSTDACSGCGICESICPAGNISMSSDGKPVWGKECMHCLACLHLCPAEAIELGTLSRGKARFKHPDVEQKELIRISVSVK